jgi:two-component system, cell cycle response regulator DivK
MTPLELVRFPPSMQGVPHDTGRGPRPAARRSRRGRGAGSGRLVLIADDAFDVRQMYSEYLTHRGFQVLTAADGAAAFEMAFALRPDVAVLDLSMPRLNGISVVHRLKQHPRTSKIPIIMLTGYAFRAIEQGALEAGASAFLTKPCLPEDLEHHVRRVLHLR